MALPESGPISTANINTELGNDAGTTVDIDDVATNDFGLDRPHGFNEFYGKSVDNFATSITNITPSSITNASAQGQTTTVSYDSDGGFKINDDNISWASVSIGSGSEGTGNTFDIVIDAQSLNAPVRSGYITFESPSLTNITYTISQLANDATLTIEKQTGTMSYGYNGGTGHYYKIETSPESQVTWIASISNTSYFSHRIWNSGDSFTTSNLSGTGDEFIEVKANASDNETQTIQGIITVDPQNIDDPSVYEYVYLAKAISDVVISPATSINDINWFSTDNFTYNESGYANRVTFTVTSNYDIDDVESDSSNFTATKYSSTQFYVYPGSTNSSESARDATVSINMNSNPVTTYTLYVSQGGAPNASITTTGTSDWSYNEYGSGQYKTISVTISNYPTTNPTLALNMFNNGKFVFRTDLTSGVTYTDDIQGDTTIAQKSVPGNGTHYFYVYPKDANNTSSDVDVDIAVSVGYTTGTISLTQLKQPDFTYSDAFVQGFAVAYDGGVTAPYAVNGTITTLNYDPDYSGGTYPIVYIPTNRYVDVTVQVPSGWPNTGGSVSGREYATQPIPPRLVEIYAYNGASTTIAGNTSSFVFGVNDVYYSNTSWTLTHEGGSTPLQGVTIVSTSGTGDTTLLTVTFNQNINTGGTRSSVFRVTSSEGYYDDITLTQNSYTPPPTISIDSVNPASPYSYYGANGIIFTVNSSNGSFSAQIGGYEISPTFPTNQPSGITRTSSTQLSSNGTTTQFYVDIPARTDGLTTTKSAFITVSTSNAGGADSDSYTLEQSGLVIWSRTPSTLSFVYTGGTETVTLSSNLSWTASISGTGFSISSGGTSGSGNKTFSITAADNSNGGARGGTLTLSASGQSDLTVSLSQAGAPLEYYYYVNGSSTGETSFPRSLGTLSYLAGGYSIGFYTYIGSNAVASPFELTKSIAGSWYGVATTTTGKLTTAASITSQSTGANAAKLYINIDSNAGNASSRAFEVELSIEGAYIGSFAGVQAADPNASSGGGGGLDPSCLIRGTKITMADGSIKRIQNLQVGDVLKSWNIDGMSDGEFESLLFSTNNLNYTESTTTVVAVQSYNVGRIYIFENDNQRILQSTHDHRHFICRNGTYWFTSSEAVREGDFLVKENGDLIEIHRVYELSNAGSFDVYKVDVEDLDLFIANDIVTHNAKKEPEL